VGEKPCEDSISWAAFKGDKFLQFSDQLLVPGFHRTILSFLKTITTQTSECNEMLGVGGEGIFMGAGGTVERWWPKVDVDQQEECFSIPNTLWWP